METSHDLIWSVDIQGRWTFVNAAVRRIYGYEPAEMLGRPFTDFLTPAQAEIDLAAFARIKAGTPHFNYETVHQRKDGSPVWLSFNAIVRRDNQGAVLGTVCGFAVLAGVGVWLAFRQPRPAPAGAR